MNGNVIQFPTLISERERFLDHLYDELDQEDFADFCKGIIYETAFQECDEYIVDLIYQYYCICEQEEEQFLQSNFDNDQ